MIWSLLPTPQGVAFAIVVFAFTSCFVIAVGMAIDTLKYWLRDHRGFLSSRLAWRCFWCRRYVPIGRRHRIEAVLDYNWSFRIKRVMTCELCLMAIAVDDEKLTRLDY